MEEAEKLQSEVIVILEELFELNEVPNETTITLLEEVKEKIELYIDVLKT